MFEALWCVHVPTTHAHYAQPSFRAAGVTADRINRALTDDDPRRAVVVPWPGSAEAHAAQLALGTARDG